MPVDLILVAAQVSHIVLMTPRGDLSSPDRRAPIEAVERAVREIGHGVASPLADRRGAIGRGAISQPRRRARTSKRRDESPDKPPAAEQIVTMPKPPERW